MTFFEECRKKRWAWANAVLPPIGKAMWTDSDVQWFMLAQMQRSNEEHETDMASKLDALLSIPHICAFDPRCSEGGCVEVFKEDIRRRLTQP